MLCKARKANGRKCPFKAVYVGNLCGVHCKSIECRTLLAETLAQDNCRQNTAVQTVLSRDQTILSRDQMGQLIIINNTITSGFQKFKKTNRKSLAQYFFSPA